MRIVPFSFEPCLSTPENVELLERYDWNVPDKLKAEVRRRIYYFQQRKMLSAGRWGHHRQERWDDFEYKIVIEMYQKGYTCREIGRELGKTPGAVEAAIARLQADQKLSRGHWKLRNEL